MLIKNGKFWLGDCLELMKNIPDGSIDMICTDIPYGEVNRKSSGLRNLDKHLADVALFNLVELIEQFDRICKGSCYVFCGIDQISEITKTFKSKKQSTRLAQWEKTNPSPMNGKHIWLSGSEFCVFARKPKSIFNRHCEKPIWKFPSMRGKQHLTMKPIELFEYIIESSSNSNDLILDPFAGSGTTAVACENTNRRWICIEKEPEYYYPACLRVASLP